MRKVVFWSATGLLVYTYITFPIVIMLRALLRRRPVRDGDVTPRASILIAAYNEADIIGLKLDSLLTLDYPPAALEIIVASDGSTDGTNEIVGSYVGRGATLLELERAGKRFALNQAAQRANGEILVFSDANSIFAPSTLRALMRPFADPRVGGVAGNQRYRIAGDEAATAMGERGYWSLDRWLKAAQSRAGNAIAGTGAIYAIRQTLFRPIPEGVNDDFYNSLQVISQGYRLVFAAEAVAYEPVGRSTGGEYQRRVRVMTRGFRTVLVMRHLLDPRRYGFYSIQLLSQKILMRTAAIPLVATAVTSVLLSRNGTMYRLAAFAQLIFYFLGVLGLALQSRNGVQKVVVGFPAYFILINTASVHALWLLARGDTVDRWQPARAVSVDGGEANPRR